jgi:hypothetical protein
MAPVGLLHARVEAGAGEVALVEQLVEFHGAGHGGHKDNELVEFKGVQEVDQLPVFLFLLQLDIVLLEPVEGEHGTVIDIDLEWL